MNAYYNFGQTETVAPTRSVLEVHTQISDPAVRDDRIGNMLNVRTADDVIHGGVYLLGETPILIARTVHDAATEKPDDRFMDIERSIRADERGEWFEHVYPLGQQNVPLALHNTFKPLVDYAARTGAFFVAAAIDGSYVVMPAAKDKRAHENGASERYAAYANLTDFSGRLATQAMICIDPGEAKDPSFTDTEQIGLRDDRLPEGQMQYSVDGTGYVADMVKKRYERGVEILEVETVAQGDLYGRGGAYELTGAATQVLRRSGTAGPANWSLTPR